MDGGLLPTLGAGIPLALDIDHYHFACDHPWGPIPHAWNLLTNLCFLVVGVWGWRAGRRLGGCANPWARAWMGLWASSMVLCFTSGWYHWTLDPPGLFADRVAICGISGFLLAQALAIAGIIRPGGMACLAVVAGFVATSVAWFLGATPWIYAVAQFAGGFLALGLYIRARRQGRVRHALLGLWLLLLGYGVAKAFEGLDVPICDALGWAGGHAFKHVFAALGMAALIPFMEAELTETTPHLDA